MTINYGIRDEQIALREMVSKMYKKYRKLNLVKNETAKMLNVGISTFILRIEA